MQTNKCVYHIRFSFILHVSFPKMHLSVQLECFWVYKLKSLILELSAYSIEANVHQQSPPYGSLTYHLWMEDAMSTAVIGGFFQADNEPGVKLSMQRLTSTYNNTLLPWMMENYIFAWCLSQHSFYPWMSLAHLLYDSLCLPPVSNVRKICLICIMNVYQVLNDGHDLLFHFIPDLSYLQIILSGTQGKKTHYE